MCGRYAAQRSADELAREFDVEVVAEDAEFWQASWNIAPTDPVRIVLDRRGEEPSRELHAARWGLLPAWSKGPGAKGAPMFNARIETVETKPAFAKSMTTRRCLVPADGYYEWRKNAPESGLAPKTPFFIADPTGASLAFAGLYAWWRNPDETAPDPWMLSTTIITQPARDGLESIHDREPVVLDHDRIAAWLNPGVTDPADALAVLRHAGPGLTWHEVSTRVGSVRNNDPGLIEAV